MQLPTHVTFGVVIQILVAMAITEPGILFYVTVFLLALLSHFILDSLAIMTYHPPQRQPTRFWLYWHMIVYISGIFFIFGALGINFLFIVGILGANLPDLWDWILLRGILKSENKTLYVHKYANSLRLLFKEKVPDLSYNKVGIIPEFDYRFSILPFFSFALTLKLRNSSQWRVKVTYF